MLTFEIGQRVCIVGLGTAAAIHVHHVVDKVTAIQVVSVSSAGIERRHRLADGRSVGTARNTYGGTIVAATCQRPRSTSAPGTDEES
jgi:hypothetical protein